ncbi:MAG: hydrogenase/urease maturation nickel metallochaperone HypA [Candidatus Zixiibacteriota bacterium]
MHELSLLKDIFKKLKSISEEKGGASIKKVTIRLGALSHISSDHFSEHFYEAAKGTNAENAELEVINSEDINDPHAQDIILESVEI